jgi:hypothetical protein
VSLVLNVEILGEFKKLTEATTGSQKSLSGLEDNAKKISRGINTALGAIGIGFSLNFLIDQFKESTKAAIEDQKSKVLLTKALQDNLKVSDQQVDSIEQYISKTQIAVGVTDDKLRPAFAKLAIATKNTDEATRLMNIALDVAAGTGKNLDVVVQAMARSLAGSDTALNRLVPSIKGADDPMKALEQTFKGAAEAAANTDPYARLQIIFGEMQEQIGMALLPILEDFSEWLSTPEGQEKLQEIVDGIVNMVTEFGKFLDYLDNKVMPGLETLTGEKGIGALITAVTNLVIGLGTLRIAMMFMTAGNPFIAAVVAGIALVAGAYSLLGSDIQEVIDKQNEFKRGAPGSTGGTVSLGAGSPISAAGGKVGIIGKVQTPEVPPSPTVNVPLGNTRIDININRAQVDGGELVDEINRALIQRGLSAKVLK